MKNEGEYVRPYWHSDLKWICGIIFAVCLMGILNLYALTVITKKEVVIPAATAAISPLLTEHVEDDPEATAKFIAELKSRPGNEVQPLPNQPVTITKAELDSLTPDQLRSLIVERLVENYYKEGIEGTAKQQNLSGEAKKSFEQQAGLLRLLNEETHKKLSRALMIVILIALLPFIGLIYFSYGAGRFVSPGILFFFTALPGTLLTTAIASAQRSGDKGPAGAIPFLPAETAREIALAIRPGYLMVLLAGVALLIIAIIYGLIRRTHHKADQAA